MPITHTNRKGVTFTLCRGTTKTGKPRYFFAREPKGEVVDEIPTGWQVQESPNGIVSLVRQRPAQIRPDEVAVVEAALRRHPKRENYRVAVKGKYIVIYERTGPDVDELAEALGRHGMGRLIAARKDILKETLDRSARFEPVMRFKLRDQERRVFEAERWCYLGSIDDWIRLAQGTMMRLARGLIPRLGSDAFFEPIPPSEGWL